MLINPKSIGYTSDLFCFTQYTQLIHTLAWLTSLNVLGSCYLPTCESYVGFSQSIINRGLKGNCGTMSINIAPPVSSDALSASSRNSASELKFTESDLCTTDYY